LNRHGPRPFDVILLRALIAAAEQNDQQPSPLDVVDPVAGPKIDLHLDDASADAPRIAGVSFLQPMNSVKNLCATLLVSQATQPDREFFSTTNLHGSQSIQSSIIVIHRLHPRKPTRKPTKEASGKVPYVSA
jgi:hypothetical protein